MPRKQAKSEPKPRFRMAGLQLVLLLWAVAVVVRLYTIQVVDHPWLSQRARDQQQETITVPAQRGTIFDRDLTPLAMSLPVQSIFAIPRKITHPAATASALAHALDLDSTQYVRLERQLASHSTFTWVERQVTAGKANAVADLHLTGIYSQPGTRRFYPKGELAASVLGFVGLDGRGLAGLEYTFNKEIGGRPGKAVLEVDAHRHSYSQVEQAPREGENLVLTIDQNIQYIVQQALDKAVKASQSQRGMAVVEDPHTGEILALANSPTFNPNDFAHTPAADLGDPAVSLPYEPGSVFKLVTVSAALQQGLITPQEMIDCDNGAIKVDGWTIHDHARFGVISVTQIIQHSSDVGAIKIGTKLGPDELYHYIRAYGFGSPTGVALPGESAGIVRPVSEWTPTSAAWISMGQELAVTPLQEVAMLSTIANDGVYHAPRLVMGTFRGQTPAQPPQFHPTPGRRIISSEVANEMKQMMAQVVLAGTAQQAQLDGYTAGGKTGTAQMAKPGQDRYSKTDYVASFAGIAPLNDPAIAVMIVLDAPHKGTHEGGALAGPIFKAIANRVLPYLGVPHDVPVTSPPPMQRAQNPLDAHEESQPAPLTPAPLPVLLPTAPTAPAGDVVIDYGGHGIQEPDFTGQTVRQVSEICQRLGLALTLQGSGVARAQAPAAGTTLHAGDRVAVSFTP